MSERFRPCAVLPTFDNPLTVRAAVEGVRVHVADVILVDDGSGPAGRAACDSIAADGLALLLRRATNGGKGAAVKAGLVEAAARGFTHVLQVDADGQHDLGRIPDFLRAGEQAPDTLLLASPVYDATVSRRRLVSRRFTAFWVGLELGRRDVVEDAMIGFRLYPLAATLAAGARGDHMDFDIEIVVRLVRAGTPVLNLPVHIRYPERAEGGVSHFQPFRDNLRFFRMHHRLCTAGVWQWLARCVRGERR